MKANIQALPAAEQTIRTRNDLAACLDVSIDAIAEIVADPARHYTSFQVPKANGEMRTIQPPTKKLRAIQRAILKCLYLRCRVPSYLHGGIVRRSIVTHAKSHVHRRMVATLDIRSFFPSTTPNRVVPVLQALGFTDAAADDLLRLVMLDDTLPQGAPSSSFLANFAFAPGDGLFLRICRNNRLSYSRYVDDIAVSGDHSFEVLREAFFESILAAGYSVADGKVHFMLNGRRQIITGLVVNDKMRPTREYLADLKHDIRLCLQLGARVLAVAEGVSVARLKSQLTGRVGHVVHVAPDVGNRLRGMLCGVNWRSSDRQPPIAVHAGNLVSH